VGGCLASLEGHCSEAIDYGPPGLGNGMATQERTALVLQEIHRVFGWMRRDRPPPSQQLLTGEGLFNLVHVSLVQVDQIAKRAENSKRGRNLRNFV
jgi:hypothetical protein